MKISCLITGCLSNIGQFCSRSGTPGVAVMVELENSWWNWKVTVILH